MIDLAGKRILVTGASSGIGMAVSQLAARLGASVILIGRNTERLQVTFESLHGIGHEFYSIDVTEYNPLEQIIRLSVGNAGPISGFVHSAGIEKTTPLKASTPQLFKEIFEVNVFAGFEIARIISQKNMADPSGASYIFISSVCGRLGEPGKIAYCASKSALLSGVRAMAIELARKKIRCNCVLPGIVETELVRNLFNTITPEAAQRIIDQHPLGLGKPDDVAALTCFLLSDQAKWITGSEYIIDGGFSA